MYYSEQLYEKKTAADVMRTNHFTDLYRKGSCGNYELPCTILTQRRSVVEFESFVVSSVIVVSVRTVVRRAR